MVFSALCLVFSLGITVVGGPLPTGTFLADSAVANQNVVDVGVLDLKLNETGPTNGEGSTTDETGIDVAHDTWEDTNHDALGNDVVSNTLEMNNSISTIGSERVNVSVLFSENDTDVDDGNAPNSSRTVEITTFEFGGTDLVGSELTDQNDNGRLDVEDLTLESNAQNLSERSGLAAGASTNLTIEMSGSADLVAGVGSGDGIDLTIEIRVHAHSFTEADRSVNNTIQYA